jgi:hypothetical protein
MLQPVVEKGDLTDRRRRPRLRLAYSVRLFRPGQTMRVETKTEDVSCEGFFCITDRAFVPHETLECELVIPGEQPERRVEQEMVLHCKAEVVRVVPQLGAPQLGNIAYGVAIRLGDYTIDNQIAEEMALACSS